MKKLISEKLRKELTTAMALAESEWTGIDENLDEVRETVFDVDVALQEIEKVLKPYIKSKMREAHKAPFTFKYPIDKGFSFGARFNQWFNKTYK